MLPGKGVMPLGTAQQPWPAEWKCFSERVPDGLVVAASTLSSGVLVRCLNRIGYPNALRDP